MEADIVYISWTDLIRLTDVFLKKINEKTYDSIVCIASGGLVLGKLVSDQLSLPLSTISAKSYKRGETDRTDSDVNIGTISTTFEIKGKILLVDDLVDGGYTMKLVKEHLLKDKNINDITTATLFKKSRTVFTPDFFVEEVNDWIVFPYEKNEFYKLNNS
jgi:hypoxanthine phosphoribosyltransferase